MKQTKDREYSFTHRMLATDFDTAASQFAMQWAIEDRDYDMAMYHHFEYLYRKDKQDALWRSMTRAEMDEYLGAVAAMEGWNYELPTST